MMSPKCYCDACGKDNQVQARFCRACGRPLQVNKPTLYNSKTGQLLANVLLNQHYRIIELIGQGGFGAVYKAADTNLGDRLVAIKEMLQSGQIADEQQKAAHAFKQEAIMLAHLDHYNLPHIFEHFEENGRWYLVMSLIQGETLESYLMRKPGGKLPLDEVVNIGIQLCMVLGYLHHQQPPIIFRDLKPANIMRAPDGRIYLIDFGIARHFKPGQSRDTTNYGSNGYAAPEQYGKAQTTPRSDIYSLGATLHQLLSGHDPSTTPFHFPSLHLLAPAVPTNLATFITQMLEMDEANRPPNMLAVRQQLQTFASSSAQIPSGSNPTSWFRPQPAVPGANTQLPPPLPGGQPVLHQPMANQNQQVPFSGQLFNTHNHPSRRKKRASFLLLMAALLSVVLVGALILSHFNLSNISSQANIAYTPTSVPPQPSTPAATNTPTATQEVATTTPTATNTPTATQEVATTTPAIGPTTPPLGKPLYKADWSQGLANWQGSQQWNAVGGGKLGSAGSSRGNNPNDQFIIWAPAQLSTPNYKIITSIQFVRSTNDKGDGTVEFGIMARGDGNMQGYEAGMSVGNADFCNNGNQQAIISRIDDAKSPPNLSCLQVQSLQGARYPIDSKLHVYELDVNNNLLTLYIDNRKIVQTTDNSFTIAGQVGLRDVLGDIDVKDFAIYAL